LRASKRVVYLRGDVLPSSYPGYFCPTSPSLYAIELNAGQAKARDIHIGETLVF
jgi:uncharacterized membrane protein (UPF0127 family)